MFRAASRAAAPRSLLPRAPSARRFLSTAPPTQKSRSWKSSAARWAVAIGAIYYYSSSSFTDDAAYPVIPGADDKVERLPTIESIIAKKRARAAQASPSASVPPTQGTIEEEAAAGLDEAGAAPAPGSPEALEEEAGQQGAFNPETGEINWDCPCLGGMAHGPCGDEFKAAFSCFVFSKEEPKGMDCIDKFKGMQDCFRQYPDIYGEEIADDGADDNDNDVDSSVGQDLAATPAVTPSGGHERAEKVADHKPHHPPSPEHEVKGRTERAKNASQQVKDTHAALEQAEAEAVVPKEWHENK